MKFGGTSVEDATAIRRLVSIVQAQLERQPIVVVSAMSKVTNSLLECAKLTAESKESDMRSLLDQITARHYAVADELALPADREELHSELKNRFEDLLRTLDEIRRYGKVSPRLSDAVSANGELLSSLLVAAAFRQAERLLARTHR